MRLVGATDWLHPPAVPHRGIRQGRRWAGCSRCCSRGSRACSSTATSSRRSSSTRAPRALGLLFGALIGLSAAPSPSGGTCGAYEPSRGPAAARAGLALPARGVHAQSADARIRAQREELDRIRRERAALEERMANLQGNVHDLREEIDNLDRQRAATERVLQTLDRQLAAISDRRRRDDASAWRRRRPSSLVRRATLQRRLVDIYKRGPLYTAEALLTARSFGELIARYKYLHEIAVHDRALVRARGEAARRHRPTARASW